MVLKQIQSEVFFYRPVNSNKSNFVSFLVFVGAAASFTAKISFFETVAKREAILIWSGPKTVNIQGNSKLREPIRTRENCYPISFFETVAKREAILIWSRPKTVNIQGNSKLWEPIRTRENCYPLIWWILKKLKDIYSSARLVLSQSVCLLNASIDSVSGIIFSDFVANSVRIIFLLASKYRQANYNLPSTIFCDIFAAYIFWCGYFMVNNPDDAGAFDVYCLPITYGRPCLRKIILRIPSRWAFKESNIY